MEGQAANTLGIGKPKVNSYALYRKTTLGISLTDALDELTEKGSLTPAQATKALEQFDKVREKSRFLRLFFFPCAYLLKYLVNE